jgi:hypothetical protein
LVSVDLGCFLSYFHSFEVWLLFFPSLYGFGSSLYHLFAKGDFGSVLHFMVSPVSVGQFCHPDFE